MNENEINDFINHFEGFMKEGKLDIKEVKNYMKLVELPFEFQIVKDNKEETFNNLYCWYKCRDDDDMIKRIPDPYFSIYVQGIVDEYCK
tara:strand:- start:3941 stop:4207 length:267 start_codon:yes stop_codon:yes gene_type:complete